MPTTDEQLAADLQHPTAESVWSRAFEVFDDESKAGSWMKTAHNLFGGKTPEELINSGDAEALRRVLEILVRIDYGVFS